MNEIVGEKLTKELISFLDNCYEAEQDNINDLNYWEKDSHFERKIPALVEKYASMANPHLQGADLEKYRKELEKDVKEFAQTNNSLELEADSIDDLARIAFSRLAKASKEYYRESVYCTNSTELSNLRKKANKLNKEYQFFANLR